MTNQIKDYRIRTRRLNQKELNTICAYAKKHNLPVSEYITEISLNEGKIIKFDYDVLINNTQALNELTNMINDLLVAVIDSTNWKFIELDLIKESLNNLIINHNVIMQEIQNNELEILNELHQKICLTEESNTYDC